MSEKVSEKQTTSAEDVNVVEPHLDMEANGEGIVAIDPKWTPEATKKLLRRVDIALIPMLMLCYLCKNIDSNIVSYVKVMQTGQPTNVLTQLHMTNNQWAYMSTIYVVPFLLFDIPSNIILKWSSPRLHFIRICAVWSIAVMCMAACKNPAGILVCRFFCGAASAGIWPGILVQLTMWYRPDELALRMASISMLGQFSGIADALLCYGIQFIDGRAGLSGWQWAFIIIGLFGVPLCVALFFLHPDYPDQSAVKWFTEEEGRYLVDRLPPNSARSTDPNFSWSETKAALSDPLTWAFGMTMLVEQTGTAGYNFWLPTIIAGFGFTSTASSQLLNIPPAFTYIIPALMISYYIDHYYKIPRPAFMLFGNCAMIAIFAPLITLQTSQKAAIYALILLFNPFSAMFQVMIYPWRAQTVKGSAYAATAFAFQNSLGQIAGIFATQIFQSQYAPSYRIPFIVCEVFLALSVFGVCTTWYLSRGSEAETRKAAKIRSEHAKANGEIVVVELHDAKLHR